MICCQTLLIFFWSSWESSGLRVGSGDSLSVVPIITVPLGRRSPVLLCVGENRGWLSCRRCSNGAGFEKKVLMKAYSEVALSSRTRSIERNRDSTGSFCAIVRSIAWRDERAPHIGFVVCHICESHRSSFQSRKCKPFLVQRGNFATATCNVFRLLNCSCLA